MRFFNSIIQMLMNALEYSMGAVRTFALMRSVLINVSVGEIGHFLQTGVFAMVNFIYLSSNRITLQ